MSKRKFKGRKLLPDFRPETMDMRIERCVIEGCGTGISLQGARNVLIRDCVIRRCRHPIVSRYSKNIFLQRTKIE